MTGLEPQSPEERQDMGLGRELIKLWETQNLGLTGSEDMAI